MWTRGICQTGRLVPWVVIPQARRTIEAVEEDHQTGRETFPDLVETRGESLSVAPQLITALFWGH